MSAKPESRNKKWREEWVGAGKTIPLCINTGCGKEIAVRHWSDAGIPSLKSECARCSTARKAGKTVEGVTIHKKTYCENIDARLEFACVFTTAEQCSVWPPDCFHMDHVDGNHENNVPENVVTLCAMCHTRKGKMSGDFNGSKSTARKCERP